MERQGELGKGITISHSTFSAAFSCPILKLLKRLIRIGDSSCLLPILAIFQDEDRKLLQSHCRWRALAILKGKQEGAAIKEAIAHLSFAILAAGRTPGCPWGFVPKENHLGGTGCPDLSPPQ